MQIKEILNKVKGINRATIYRYSFENFEEIKVEEVEVIVSHIIFSPYGKVEDIIFSNYELLETIHYSDFDALNEDSWYPRMYSEKNNPETLIEFKKLLIDFMKDKGNERYSVSPINDWDNVKTYTPDYPAIIKKLEGDINGTKNN